LKNFKFNKALIIGLGLLGGSIAKALKKYHLAHEIWANDNNLSSIELAKSQKIINGYYLLDDNLNDFDLIILCSPLNTYQNIFTKISNKINPQATFFDIGSIKNFKFKNIPKNFVGCHPIAGAEHSGYTNSQDNLFYKNKFIICDNSVKDNVKIIDFIIRTIEAEPLYLDSHQHDKIYSLVSHLPQFLSFLTKEFSAKNIDDDFFKTAFRLDNSNPEIWEDIFKFNQNNLSLYYEKLFINIADLIEDLENFNIKDHEILIDKFIKNSSFNNSSFNYLEKNFNWIFFRFLLALSLIKIPELNTLQDYIGKGFIDFTSILAIKNFDQQKFNNLVFKNRSNIINLFNKISE
jgi:prephenate dehydrogenase